jgi:ribosomal protein S18 acetylase RimI-like enzyme
MIDLKTQVVIRRFDAARDAQSLRACLIDHQNFHRRIEPSWPDGEAIVSEYMKCETECTAHNGCILIAHCAEQVAGFICVVAATRGESPEDPSPFAWIHELYVKPEHRRRGVASLLMAEAERFARCEGAHVLRLGVLEKNEGARRFYTRQGFGEQARVLTKPLE